MEAANAAAIAEALGHRPRRQAAAQASQRIKVRVRGGPGGSSVLV